MGQLTLYLDAETQVQLKQAAQAHGISMSRWVAGVIREKAGAEWSPAIRELSGAWSDFPDAEAIREDTGEDVPRLPL